MKKLIIAFLFLAPQLQALDSLGLIGIPFFWNRSENPRLYWSFGPTVSLYHLSRSTILDLGSNKDFLKNNRIKAVPGFCFDIGRNWTEVSWKRYATDLNYGLRISYAHGNKALTNDYWEPGQTASSFDIKQDVRDLRFTPYIACEKTYKERFKYGLSAGFGIGVHVLDNFKAYEKATKAYIGQRLKAASMSFLGEFGAKMQFQLRNTYNLKAEYIFSIGNANYKKKVYIETPEATATQTFQNQALLIDKDAIYLPKTPRLKMRSHRFSLSLGKDF